MGSLDLITDHPYSPTPNFIDATPSGVCFVCPGVLGQHLLSQDGEILVHAWLGPLSEREVGDSPCRVKMCGLLKSALVHRGMDPEFLPETPDPNQMFRPLARPIHATELIPAVQAWDTYAAQVRDIIVRKSEGYGDAWQAQGYMGNLARVMSKESRLRNMLWGDNTDGDYSEGEVHPEYESVMDTLVDLGALAAFMVSNLEEGNRWGR